MTLSRSMNVLLSGPSLLRQSFLLAAHSPSSGCAACADVCAMRMASAMAKAFHMVGLGCWHVTAAPEVSRTPRRKKLQFYFTETNGTAEPGTIVVGSTPFQRSACTSVTRLGLVPSALARASMAAASASPVILI